MNPTTYETSDRRRHATRRTWLAAGGAAAALLVVLALVVAAYQARTDRTDPLAGAAGTPSAASPAPTASPEVDQAEGTDEAGEDTGQTGTGGNQSGGNQSGDDGEDGEGADDGEDGEGDDGEDVPPVIDVSAKAAATVAPATHHAINCDPTNITVHGTITLTGGLWLPGPPPTKVTVEYRWILDGEPGLAQAVHFTSPGEQDVSTSMSLTGNATAAIEVLGPNQSTSPDAAIHLFCS